MTSSSLGLAAADRKLLRDVFAWGHTSGWTYTRTGRDYTFDHPEAGTVEASDGLRRINAYYWRDLGQHHVSFWPESVTEAVDVLVALGILPARFSSAFTAGRESVAGEVQWGARSRNSDECVYKVGPSPDEAREWIGNFTHRFDLVRRVLGDWEVVG